MKNIYFKRKDSVLRSLQEEKKKKRVRKINWDRLIYFILLSIFLFFVGRYAFLKIYYVKADGQIHFKNLSIQNLDDCRITKFIVNEGDYVHKGDTLFYFHNDDDGENNGNSSAQISFSGKTKTDWQDKAIIELEADLDILKKELRLKRKIASKLESELVQIQQEVLLEVLPKSALYQKQSELDKVNSEIDGLIEERSILNEKLMKIRTSERTSGFINGIGSGSGSGNDNGLKPFISPMEGIITKIFKENQEVALKSEVIMYIQKSENVYIKAFFEQEDLKYLKNRNKVELEFPDGTECYGRISRFYYSTYRLPEEFQKKYEPTTRSLSVDIVPLNRQEFLKWQKFYKLGVIVRKVRF
jgi:multidrug resistance efflux pump